MRFNGLYIQRPRFLVVGEPLYGIVSNAGCDEIRRDCEAFAGKLLRLRRDSGQDLTLSMSGDDVLLGGYVHRCGPGDQGGLDAAVDQFAKDVSEYLGLTPKVVKKSADDDEYIRAVG